MKNPNSYAGIFLGALLLFMAACTPLLDSPEAQFQAANAGEGTIVLSINGSEARTLAPAQDFVKYEIFFKKTDPLTGVESVEKSLTVTSTEAIQERLEAGEWSIVIIGYVDVNGAEEPSVTGFAEDINLIAGAVAKINIFLDTPAALDVPGYFEYKITVPGNVAANYDQSRDAYGNISDGDFIGTSKGDPADYFSGAVLRIVPDPASGYSSSDHVSQISNQGHIFIDLNYGDESPGNGVPRPDPNRLAEGRIELPPGRYRLYLSLVSDRSIDYYSREDYIGIFKEEVVYIYPNMTTTTPLAYTQFTNADLTAQVFFEGHATVSGNAAYTPQRVWIDLSNSHAGSDTHGRWSAPITEKDGSYEWNLYIPSHEIAGDLYYSEYNGQSVYFRFELNDGARTLFSPWQEYKTREKQGQVDIDLYAHVETVTVPSSITITTEGVYKDTIARIGNTSVYDVVRGVNFDDPGANKALFKVSVPTGRAIAYFEARTSDDGAIAWRYADSNFLDNLFGYSYPYPYAAEGSPVVYEIDNHGGYPVLNHEIDNERINYADLGDSPVVITTGFFNFNVELTLPTGNLPVYNRALLEVYDAATDLVIATASAATTSPFTWTIAPEDELPVYYDDDLWHPGYHDYSIYEYDEYGDPNKTALDYFGYSDYDYSSNKGVYFAVTFEETDADDNVIASYPLAPTKRYTAPELVGQIKLGIASTADLSATQTINANAGVGSSVYDSPEQYYYFAADPGVPYYLEYQDAATTDFISGDPTGSGLTGIVSVKYRHKILYGFIDNYLSGSSPIATILPATGANAKVLVSVIVRASSEGSYKLIKNTSVITPQASEQTFAIPTGATRYYTFTPSSSTAVYSLGFKGNGSDLSLADVNVSAYAYDDDEPTGISGSYVTASDGATSYQGGGLNSLGFLNPAGKKTLITVTSSYGWPDSGREFKITLTDLTAASITTNAAAAKTIAQNAVQHFVFTPAATTPATNYTFLYKDAGSLIGSNNASLNSVRLYTYTPGIGGALSLSTTLSESIGSTQSFTAGTRALVEVEDGSATSGVKNYELEVTAP
jgi:hypothetical protein